ncbi:MAG: hypothetical protein GC134_08290 [Proteobacteria bacterium]|nr:hypothetical protein [Pseudomonadota bacterium]
MELLLLLWWPWAILKSLGAAGFVLVNQQAGLTGSTLMFWRGFGVALALLPVVCLIPLPDSPIYYAAILTNGVLVGISDTMVFNSARQFGAGPTSRLSPMGIWIGFALWLAIAPDYRMALLAEPVRFAGVVLAVVMAVSAMAFFRKDPISASAIRFLVPVIVMGGFIDILNKTAMSHVGDALWGGIVGYGFTVSLMAGTVSMAGRWWQTRRLRVHEFFTPHAIKYGLVMMVVILTTMVTKNMAMHLTPNPTYVTTISLAAPLWVMAFNKMRGVTDRSNIWAGILFVASAILLIWLGRG